MVSNGAAGRIEFGNKVKCVCESVLKEFRFEFQWEWLVCIFQMSASCTEWFCRGSPNLDGKDRSKHEERKMFTIVTVPVLDVTSQRGFLFVEASGGCCAGRCCKNKGGGGRYDEEKKREER